MGVPLLVFTSLALSPYFGVRLDTRSASAIGYEKRVPALSAREVRSAKGESSYVIVVGLESVSLCF